MSNGGVKEIIDEVIRKYRVTVFIRPGCPHCLGAKNIVRKYIGRVVPQAEVCFVDIEQQADSRAFQNYLQLITGAPAVPSSFINGQFVGGQQTLRYLHTSGQLTDMLQTTIKR
ncbi:glutaredoxin-like [Dreissena polymorpha]|uniref:Glutaredoxin-1 n=1 Tax=Dreissena polymorpha TaxID=45954 RepID=A0A9D4H8B6_DREPO|nr:glutaredoxin-like [Dreissena polymorpha]KAH3830127.1 hypothetical protein DPMN_103364 [Dreissena polymorpha]